MVRFRFSTSLLLLLFLLPAPGWAHGNKKDGHSAASRKSPQGEEAHQQQARKQPDGTLVLETQTIDGIRSVIYLRELGSRQDGNGPIFTHRLSVDFLDAVTGQIRNGGQVALRFTTDHDESGQFEALTLQEGRFTTRLHIARKGEQHFLLATRLEDGRKRNFHFHFDF